MGISLLLRQFFAVSCRCTQPKKTRPNSAISKKWPKQPGKLVGSPWMEFTFVLKKFKITKDQRQITHVFLARSMLICEIPLVRGASTSKRKVAMGSFKRSTCILCGPLHLFTFAKLPPRTKSTQIKSLKYRGWLLRIADGLVPYPNARKVGWFRLDQTQTGIEPALSFAYKTVMLWILLSGL